MTPRKSPKKLNPEDREFMLSKMNCIIVHGSPDTVEKAEKRTYDKHWIPWLRRSLSEKGFHVFVPLMPQPWKPDYLSWKKEFDKLNDFINEESILVGHSAGTAFLVRWLGDTKKKVKKLILVAPWKIAYKKDGIDKDFYEYKIDSSVRKNVGKIAIFTSNDEELKGKRSANIFNEFLEGEVIELKNKGHYTLGDMGTEEFPELLQKILE